MIKISPDTDGVNHINIYSKGKTELGKLLTNFAYTPFTYPPYGKFASVEAFWYWAKTGMQHEDLKHLHGFNAKQQGKLKQRVECHEFNDLVLEAIRCKLRQNRDLLKMLTDSTLPLEHYYAYGNERNYKIVHLPQYQWIVDEIDRIRKVCQERYLIKKWHNNV